MKKQFSLLLAALLLSTPLLASCASDSPDTPSTDTAAADTQPADTTAETTRENYPDSLPALDFGGENMNIHVRGDAGCIDEVFVEELTGEVVNDAVFERNEMVEERLNVDITIAIGDTWEKYNNTVAAIRSSIAAADGAYDAISGWSARIPALSLEGLFLDLNGISYLDFEKPWWNQSATDELQIAGKLHFITGDIAQSMLASMCVYVVNQKVATDLGVENLFDVVREHRWTIDYVHELVSDKYVDLNGDGARDVEDMYGLLSSSMNDADGYMQGSLVSMVSRDENGLPVLDVDMEQMTTLVEKVYELMWNNPGTSAITGDGTDLKPFIADLSLLATTRIGSVTDILVDMESSFGILPYPLLNDSQKEYGTRVQDSLSLWSIPIDVADPDLSGAVLEALAAQSYRTVTPAYFDTALKNRYSRDADTAEMVDLLKDSIYINFESLYNESIGNPWFVLRMLMPQKSSNFASYWATNEKVVTSKLAEAVKLIEELD